MRKRHLNAVGNPESPLDVNYVIAEFRRLIELRRSDAEPEADQTLDIPPMSLNKRLGAIRGQVEDAELPGSDAAVALMLWTEVEAHSDFDSDQQQEQFDFEAALAATQELLDYQSFDQFVAFVDFWSSSAEDFRREKVIQIVNEVTDSLSPEVLAAIRPGLVRMTEVLKSEDGTEKQENSELYAEAVELIAELGHQPMRPHFAYVLQSHPFSERRRNQFLASVSKGERTLIAKTVDKIWRLHPYMARTFSNLKELDHEIREFQQESEVLAGAGRPLAKSTGLAELIRNPLEVERWLTVRRMAQEPGTEVKFAHWPAHARATAIKVLAKQRNASLLRSTSSRQSLTSAGHSALEDIAVAVHGYPLPKLSDVLDFRPSLVHVLETAQPTQRHMVRALLPSLHSALRLDHIKGLLVALDAPAADRSLANLEQQLSVTVLRPSSRRGAFPSPAGGFEPEL